MTGTDRPDVLLITVDQWSAHMLGAAGHPVIQTPTLDELCRNGTRFTNAHSECPICVPARRSLMTGASSRRHGDRVYDDQMPMPPETLAASFSAAGYQTHAVGKLHVFPQRDRIGFHDVQLEEEGRAQYGVMDDYEIWLGDKGYPGQQFDHGMSTDGYVHRPWHLPEELHVTNWSTQQMIRQIKRRDPLRPAFWYLAYRHPHPPLVPLQAYLDMYRDMEIEAPITDDWDATQDLPFAVASKRKRGEKYSARQIAEIRRAFYALCTHIDHQLRLIIGTLREEMLLDNTIILFTSDHGDMLGDHGLWAKSLFYRGSANVPMILMGRPTDTAIGIGAEDDRLVTLADVMPTLLSLAGIEVPDSADGRPMISESPRQMIYGEFGTGSDATRMVRDARYKLIYYPVGNRCQLFDLQSDPDERHDLAGTAEYTETLDRLTTTLIAELYGSDLDWIRDGKLIGLPDKPAMPRQNRNLSSQRGHHWPPQKHSNMRQLLTSA
ncbi:sulfatase-like hydrolase/transferase [Paracoccus sp. SCSIO 75233]|uniref:sulfatase-like hydrolase/transferase n=1 Tax=Paracoccus sp. SCSIO 75233 TaxID=3017782 RepID=UPI0022F0ADF5|nr:sulfatase-like hydrolase/transferase [Paracoccus sp. SCSIO 75233]WBU52870.1 sulfatase-like hydrolase/transferase [Paracoccus sp. SCSIO 75233]